MITIAFLLTTKVGYFKDALLTLSQLLSVARQSMMDHNPAMGQQ
jgi:hypothetical protein